ncbi:cytochrome P450 [Streptosporangium fragile]|uniref:Cytochrome P450 n=2 Tax=Streptosporangium fragile TaxID=46186 RepID=A0ABN3W6L8_9ACTN
MPQSISPLTADAVDLTDMDLFTEAAAPWRMFDVLRRTSPVHWQPEPAPNKGFWAVTRHADIVAVLKDPGTFTSEKFVTLEEVEDDSVIAARSSMLEIDGLRHTALRRLLQHRFTHRAIAGYADLVRDLTVRTLDNALAEGTSFDFVSKISAEFPIQVLARMMDVPEGDTHKFVDWGNRIIAAGDSDYSDGHGENASGDGHRNLPFGSPASLELFQYGRSLAAKRRANAGTDLVSLLVNGVPVDGVPLSGTEFDNYFLLLVLAGNETTRHTISHAMLALMQNPEQLERLRADFSLMPDAVEEFLRWASPVYYFRRTATRAAEIGGTPIQAGDKVAVWFASGNRDESVFDAPYRFDVGRQNNDHLAFGKSGPHFCLGSALARLELKIMFEELLQRISGARLIGPVRRVRSNLVNGIKELPVEVTPASGG